MKISTNELPMPMISLTVKVPLVDYKVYENIYNYFFKYTLLGYNFCRSWIPNQLLL